MHETSHVDEGASIGARTKIWHFCHVLSGTTIGVGCVLGQNVMAGPRVRIGDNVKIQNNVSVYEGVEIEDDVFCGPSMVFTNVATPRSAVSHKHAFQTTLVKRGASLGANCTIVCGHTIGCYAFVAAGAVVTSDVPDFALMMGVPARRAGWVCECGTRLADGPAPICRECGARYKLSEGRLRQCAPGRFSRI